MIKFTFGLLATAIILALLAFYIGKRREHAKQYKNFKTSRECMAAFKVKVPEDCVVFHKNGDKHDNTFNNLEVITRTELMERLKDARKRNRHSRSC